MAVRAKRSLKASSEGIDKANKAVLTFATKLDLAAEVGISRATIQNFFAGKPIGRENFHKICQKLELSWKEIAEIDEEPEIQPQQETNTVSDDTEILDDIDTLVKELRLYTYTSIQEKCGMMRVLDMSQPIGLNDIYTNVNILEKINGRRWIEVAELLKVSVSDDFERPGLGKVTQERVPGLEVVENHSKLIVLGKPGAGKTTFLKHIAIQCILGRFKADLVPIFINLKNFAEAEHQPSLLKYITEQFVSSASNTKAIKQILSQGRALILLDGLDEVKEIDAYRVVQEVRNFSAKFYLNYFVITCRIATREYIFEQFTEVEVADFDQLQINTFVNKWFASKDSSKSKKLIEKLIQNPPLQELATNPLLLTLLCLIFEESADFPLNRSQLYEEGVNVLLKKWDGKRNIERQQTYKNLSLQHKVDLLSQIALKTFERGDYFFRQRELEQYIADYICNFPNASNQLETLQLNSEAVLKSIESQHGLLVERARGIYSFSHLTFHEYFTAKEIVSAPNPQAIDVALKKLVSHLTQKRWREVFLLTVEMLRNADYFLQLMKQKIDQLLATDEELQTFLRWVSQKSRAVDARYKPVIVRAFYFDLDLARMLEVVGGSLDLARVFNPNLTRNLDPNLTIDLALDRTLGFNRIIQDTPNPITVFNAVISRAIERASLIDPELEDILQKLQQQIAYADADSKGFKVWWDKNGEAWTEQLRAIMISYRNFGHDWQFSNQQKETLKQYYDANILVMYCLNSNCYMTNNVRQKIADSLLLPFSEL